MNDSPDIDPRFEQRIRNAWIQRIQKSSHQNKKAIIEKIAKQMPDQLERMKEAGFIKGGISSEKKLIFTLSDDMYKNITE